MKEILESGMVFPYYSINDHVYFKNNRGEVRRKSMIEQGYVNCSDKKILPIIKYLAFEYDNN